MATKIRKHTDQKKIVRFKRKRRIRSSIMGDAERPRISVFRSNVHLYVQVIDDDKGATLVSASTLEGGEDAVRMNNLEGAKLLGKKLAEKAKAQGISQVVFDRSGYLYHGKIKALADSLREAGLKF